MRALILILALTATAAQAAPERRELVTAANAILCLSPGNLTQASQPEIAQSQQRLRNLRCMRTEPGIPLTLIEQSAAGWKISFRPQGIPGGITLWGRAKSFTTPDGTPLIHSTRAAR